MLVKSTTFAFWMCLLLVVCGCSKQSKNETLTIEKVPEKLMAVARETLPDTNWVNAYKFEKDGEVIYEIRGKNEKGKIVEVEVNEEGKVVEIE
jgi:hypothetical protein